MFRLSKHSPRKIVFRWYLIVTRKPIQHLSQSMYQQSRSCLSGQLGVAVLQLQTDLRLNCKASTYLQGVDKQNLVEIYNQWTPIERIKGRSGFTASRIQQGPAYFSKLVWHCGGN